MPDPRLEVIRALELPRARRDGRWRYRTWDGAGSGSDDAASPMVARRSGRSGRPPSFSTSNAATITLVTDEPQDLTEDGTVEFHAVTATRRSFATPAFPAAGPALPFGGVYSMQADLPLVTPVPAGTRFRIVDGAGSQLWRPSPDQWEIGWPRLIGEVDWVSLHVPGQDWAAGISPRIAVEVPEGETVTVGAGGRCTWKMEGTPAAGPALFLPGDIPTAGLVFDGDPDEQGGTIFNQIFDFSGNNNHSTSGAVLNWVDDVLDGKAVWRDGNQGSTDSGEVELGARPQLWACVARASSTSTARGHLLGRHTGSANTANMFYQVNQTLRGHTDLVSGNVLDTGWHVMTILQHVQADGVSKIWLDDTEVASESVASPDSDGRRQLLRNTFNPNGVPWVGDVARMLAYDVDGLTSAEAALYYQNEILPALQALYPSLPS